MSRFSVLMSAVAVTLATVSLSVGCVEDDVAPDGRAEGSLLLRNGLRAELVSGIAWTDSKDGVAMIALGTWPAMTCDKSLWPQRGEYAFVTFPATTTAARADVVVGNGVNADYTSVDAASMSDRDPVSHRFDGQVGFEGLWTDDAGDATFSLPDCGTLDI